ncbi:MAG: hypothetical protein ACYDBJ_24080 [Aggregatilineales bacterium]
MPGLYGSWPVYLPSNVVFAYIYITDSVRFQVYSFLVYPNNTAVGPPNRPPCYLTPPIFPTPLALDNADAVVRAATKMQSLT